MPFSLLSRRDLLRAGGIAVGASLTGGLRPPLAKGATPAKAKSVIFLWLAGGVTHHESFDPKPEAPMEIRGELKTIQTAIPATLFTEVMPCMAKQADKIA